MKQKKEWGLFFASLVFIFFVILIGDEIFLRVLYGSAAFPETLGGGLPPHLVTPDTVLGYTLTPGFVGKQIVPGHPTVEYRINQKGLRDDDRVFLPSDKLIIAIGYSFTFGHGVAYESIWPAVLENKIRAVTPSYHVMKAGVPGFSWPQYAIQYRRITEGLPRHSLVIVGFTVDAGERLRIGYEARGGILVKQFYPNLIVRDGLVYEKPTRFERVNQIDAFLRNHSYFFRWFNFKLSLVYHRIKKSLAPVKNKNPSPSPASNPLPPSERKHVQEALSILEDIHERARGAGAQMLVLFISLPHQDEDEIAYYREELLKHGVSSLDLSVWEDTPSWRFSPNGHWNAFGHTQVAEKVFDWIQEHRLLNQ